MNLCINLILYGFRKNWRPGNSSHFEKSPKHCIRNSYGAEFPEGLNSEKFHKVFLKGTGSRNDCYSAFEAINENLVEYIRKNSHR